jgi:hypothetical protein
MIKVSNRISDFNPSNATELSIANRQGLTGTRDAFLTVPVLEDLVFRERQCVPIAIQCGFGGLCPFTHQTGDRIGSIGDERGVPWGEILLAEPKSIGPEAVPAESRGFGRVRRTQSLPNVILCQPTNSFLEIAISPGTATAGKADG